MSQPASHDAARLIARLRALSDTLGSRRVSRSTWVRETGINDHHIIKHFDSWNRFVEAAGLVVDDRRRLTDDELFEAMRDAFLKAGGIVTRTALRKCCRYSDDAYAKRWGRWNNVLVRFRTWVEGNEPGFPYLHDLPRQFIETTSKQGDNGSASGPLAWTATQRTRYGTFLNFRGLQHAPINEQGVVFLFGMVAFDLGYVVEGVGTGFPDCEAKRCVSQSDDAWERVRVEFEFRSRNFLAHGHDPAGCDVIVCWEDNWSESPVEVLELRSAIETLGSDGNAP